MHYQEGISLLDFFIKIYYNIYIIKKELIYMKLKKIINYLDKRSFCKIWINDEEDPVYEGYIMDIPWYLLDYPLCNDSNGEAIGAVYDKDATNSNHRSYFAIFLLEEE
jgi:hypothetical protein